MLALALTALASPAGAWDVTFERDPVAGNRTSSSFNLVVTIQQQGGNVIDRCDISWSDGDNACTIEDFPSTTNALVNIFHRTSGSGMQDTVIGKISFWVGVFSDMSVHIPTGVASFKADKTWSELVALPGGGIDVAILPQANVEMGDNLSNRPNSGTTYFGQSLGNCGEKDLASDQVDPSVCKIDYLAGCYSPVWAYPKNAASKTKIGVNRGDAGGADHALCIGDGETVPYELKIE